jgi:hypothetical protein
MPPKMFSQCLQINRTNIDPLFLPIFVLLFLRCQYPIAVIQVIFKILIFRGDKISFIVFAVSVVIFIFIILPKLLAVNLLFLSLSHSSLLRCLIVKIGIDSEYNLQWFLSQPITGNIWIHTTIMGPIKILEDYQYFSCKYSSNFLLHRTKCKTSRTSGKCFFLPTI